MTEAELDLPTQPRLAPVATRVIRCKECGGYACTVDLNECSSESNVRMTIRMQCRNKRCPYTLEFEIVAKD